MRDIIKLVVVLTLICGISAGSLTLVRESLEEQIEKQNDLNIRGPALERLFNQPADKLLDHKVTLQVEDYAYPVFYIKSDDKITGLAIEAPGAGGYGGDIMVMIGLDMTSNRMVGIEIIQHNETPGVGSQVEKATFRKQWINLSIDEPVTLTSQGGKIDAISGATYSTKAVVNGTNKIIDLIKSHKDEIMASIEARQG